MNAADLLRSPCGSTALVDEAAALVDDETALVDGTALAGDGTLVGDAALVGGAALAGGPALAGGAAAWRQRQERYWDGISDHYNGLYAGRWSRLEDAWVERRLGFLRRLAEPTVLDLGCGTGLGLRMVRRLNPAARYVGVDVSAQMVHGVGDPLATLHLGTMDDLSFLPDGSVDVALGLFSSVSYGYDTGRVFAEVARTLRPGGWAYLSVLSDRALSRVRGGAPLGMYRTRGDRRPQVAVPVRRLDVARVRELARRSRLTVVRSAGMNVLSGLFEQPAFWHLGRLAARLAPDRAHTIETLLRKDPDVDRVTPYGAPAHVRRSPARLR
ncbi:hypothetical protein GCM10022225_25560 [Plantactinospora mayteni]|uniref:Methyltransferase domain-containing protein n=1 Tax=Plantactinospora mayteni TaxID=566021 RepID=A0ABQ4EJA8_9ACTN|nr:class I SAM-dependent methyltransferase [Plantactinospora mayteni]GIG94714.1 hypothetical protein Pma05_12870 [Plantactinospora mayteni]